MDKGLSMKEFSCKSQITKGADTSRAVSWRNEREIRHSSHLWIYFNVLAAHVEFLRGKINVTKTYKVS
jgi:hypothetical protein